jgi:hypothetical protein
MRAGYGTISQRPLRPHHLQHVSGASPARLRRVFVTFLEHGTRVDVVVECAARGRPIDVKDVATGTVRHGTMIALARTSVGSRDSQVYARAMRPLGFSIALVAAAGIAFVTATQMTDQPRPCTVILLASVTPATDPAPMTVTQGVATSSASATSPYRHLPFYPGCQ